MKAFSGLLLVFAFVLSSTASAQENQPAAPPAGVQARTASLEIDAREVREHLRDVLTRYPPDVGRILKMDPTMLTNQQYLAQYPALQQFLTAHPEIARNPAFFLEFVRQSSDYTAPVDAQSRAIDMWGDVMEAVGVFAIVAFVSGMFAWLVKTVLNHRRWLRASRIQTEVHNKLLDRFAGTDDLATYVQSAAGRRFLEAAPIPVDAGATEQPIAAPLNRILWSVQAGIVLTVGGLGFQFVSGRVVDEVAQGLWTIGVLATAFGIGFILAGAFSFVMSRRLGLFDAPVTLRDADRSDSPAV